MPMYYSMILKKIWFKPVVLHFPCIFPNFCVFITIDVCLSPFTWLFNYRLCVFEPPSDHNPRGPRNRTRCVPTSPEGNDPKPHLSHVSRVACVQLFASTLSPPIQFPLHVCCKDKVYRRPSLSIDDIFSFPEANWYVCIRHLVLSFALSVIKIIGNMC